MGVRKFIKRLFTFRWARGRKKPYPTRTDAIGVRGSIIEKPKSEKKLSNLVKVVPHLVKTVKLIVPEIKEKIVSKKEDKDISEEIEISICIKCEYQYQVELCNFHECQNTDLPITDFVYGARNCMLLNTKGDCKGFKLRLAGMEPPNNKEK